MESKKRPFSSLLPDDIPATATSPDLEATPLASRRAHFTSRNHRHGCLASPVPTGRFSFRRSSDTTSSAPSISTSSTFKSLLSCVTRQTLPDECARYRFIAWVAAKRNECQHMNDVDKLECPLLRCRKRFVSHEELVKHIFDCEHLAGGEYWCFEHLRAERFDDGRCKGCCCHPTRRRKILSMAKTFFSNLGHKSKNKRELAAGAVDNDSVFLCPPPSYESLHPNHPSQELSATNEIYELPSPDPVPVQTVSPPGFAPEVVPTVPLAEATQALMNGSQTPALLVNEGAFQFTETSRPSLQLNTQVGNQKPIRPPPAPRSKNLSPSSSVRSTTSTTSTLSNISTISTTSSKSLVSPISVWSEASSNPFAGAPGYKTTAFASPPYTLLPDEIVTEAMATPDKDDFAATFTADFGDIPELSELPGEISFDMEGNTANSLNLDTPLLGIVPMALENCMHDPATTTTMPIANPAIYGSCTSSQQPTSVNSPSFLPFTPDEIFTCSNYKNIIDTVWATLGEALRQSLEKLKQIDSNPLARKMMSLNPKQVAEWGIEALESVFKSHRNPADPIKALCLVHLVYAFSIPVYEKHAMNRYNSLFFESLEYILELPEESRGFYRDVVSILWQPVDVTKEEVERCLANQLVQSLSRSSSFKGKQREQPIEITSSGKAIPFVKVAQDFFDDLESTIVFHAIEQPPANHAVSALHATHTEAQQYGTLHASPALLQISPSRGRFQHILAHIIRQYQDSLPDIDDFHNKLRSISLRVNNGSIGSARKAELEVLRVGKCCLDTSFFFDTFVPKFRAAANLLYQQLPDSPFLREIFYLRDIAVLKSIMHDLNDIPTHEQPACPSDWYSDFIVEQQSQPLPLPPSQPGGIGSISTSNLLGPPSTTSAASHSNISPMAHSKSFDHSLSMDYSSIPSPEAMTPLPTRNLSSSSSSHQNPISHHTPSSLVSSNIPLVSTTTVTSTASTLSPSFVNINPFLYSDGSQNPAPSLDIADPPFSSASSQPPHGNSAGKIATSQSMPSPSTTPLKMESTEQCEICGYRPKGDPRWFQGSMAKHKKTKHSAGPDKMYRCPYPGCQSAYKNREDNLKQHMKEKGHFISEDPQSRRPSKRKRVV